MKICINGCPVDFQLEGETSLPDLVDSVSQWARERDLVFNEIEVDGSPHYTGNIPAQKLDGVETINCIVRSKADVVFSTIDEGVRYCDRALSFIDGALNEQGDGGYRDLVPGIEWLMDVMKSLFTLLGLEPGRVKIKDRPASAYAIDLAAFRNALDAAASDDRIISVLRENRPLLESFKDLLRILLASDEMKRLIIQSVDSPDAILQSLSVLREEMGDQLRNIELTAVAYQTGRDADGSAGMNRFIDFMYRYTRTCYQAVPVFQIDLKDIRVNGTTLDEKNQAIHKFLNETIMILENRDIISLADILEYEILPAAADLGVFLDRLESRITGGEES